MYSGKKVHCSDCALSSNPVLGVPLDASHSDLQKSYHFSLVIEPN